MESLLDHQPASTAPERAAADRADQESLASLLRCWVRETGMAAPKDDQLVLDLSSSGVRIEVPVVYWSPVGWHRFGPARFSGGQTVTAPALAALLSTEVSGDDPASVTDLTARVTDSARKVATFLEERAAQPELDEKQPEFLRGERALVCGHPLHPTPKSREGLSDRELRRYSPELGGAFPLHWFAADPEVVQADSALSSSAQRLCAELAGPLAERAGSDRVLVPAHPWQAREVRDYPATRALLDSGALCDLGEGGPTWSATSSVRTLYRADAPVMLKFSLGLRITNSRRENLRVELRRGVAVHRLLESGLADALHARYPDFDIVRDPAWLAVDGPQGAPTGLDVAVRDNPFRSGEPQAVCVAGLVSTRPDRPGGESWLTGLVRDLSRETGEPVQDVAEEWCARYLDQVIEPVLWLYARYGLGLEAHQQNTLVVLDDDGWPTGGRYRDNQGFYFSPTRSPALYDWVPRVGRDLGTFVDDEVIDERLAYYVGINNALGLVGALGSAGLADETRLLERARARLTHWSREHGDRLRLAELLRDAPRISCKANLLTRVRGMDELTGPLEAQSVYVDIANPLSEVTR
ncbi:IucA/IucC family protein [Streptomyces sp. NPDC005438]|uniref:IucA/IucC family protein n=1 Tax=Streptomyces sp. NPDC005438 TaxID=3156880 RepID=UPI0033ACCFBF